MLIRGILLCGSMVSATSWAMAPPSSPEELEAAASLILDGRVTDVRCTGMSTVDSRGVTTTTYLARLERRGDPIKGPALAVVNLPFEDVDYGDGPAPGCAWVARFPRGMSGRFWLTEIDGQAADTYRMVHWNAFDAAQDHEPEELPNCDDGPDPRSDAGPGAPDGGPNPELADSGVALGADAGPQPTGQVDAGLREAPRPGEPGEEGGGLFGCSQTGMGLSWFVVFALMMLRRRRPVLTR